MSEMIWHVYLRKGTVFVPTVARADAGFFLDIDPVTVLKSTDCDGISKAVKETVSKGNPVVVTPTRGAFPKPIILSYAKVKSWTAFEKDAFCWKIVGTEVGEFFQLHTQRKSLSNGWEDDPTKYEVFSGPTALDDLAVIITGHIQKLDIRDL